MYPDQTRFFYGKNLSYLLSTKKILKSEKKQTVLLFHIFGIYFFYPRYLRKRTLNQNAHLAHEIFVEKKIHLLIDTAECIMSQKGSLEHKSNITRSNKHDVKIFAVWYKFQYEMVQDFKFDPLCHCGVYTLTQHLATFIMYVPKSKISFL